jgi:hypothetical protein
MLATSIARESSLAEPLSLTQRESTVARTERRLIDREIHGMVSVYRKAGIRLMAIEDAMKPDMRVKFWQLVDTEDVLERGNRYLPAG